MADIFVYQNSPTSVVLVVEIARGNDYPDLDLTTVTSVVGEVYLPGATEAAEWIFTPVEAETTEDVLVCSRAFEEGDTAVVGTISMRLTPFVGDDPAPPTGPLRLLVRSWH